MTKTEMALAWLAAPENQEPAVDFLRACLLAEERCRRLKELMVCMEPDPRTVLEERLAEAQRQGECEPEEFWLKWCPRGVRLPWLPEVEPWCVEQARIERAQADVLAAAMGSDGTIG